MHAEVMTVLKNKQALGTPVMFAPNVKGRRNDFPTYFNFKVLSAHVLGVKQAGQFLKTCVEKAS